jgi:hypothetical protein
LVERGGRSEGAKIWTEILQNLIKRSLKRPIVEGKTVAKMSE